jgi:TRAP-type mannitol/chloroaromatic compound transport system substrate-binding protein
MKTIRWVIAHEPIDLFLRAANRFSKQVKEQTNGAIDIEVLSLTDYAKKYNDGNISYYFFYVLGKQKNSYC